MYSIRKIIYILLPFSILLLLLLNSCSDRSEYGSESNYEKLGADATGGDTDTTDTTIPSGSGTIKGSVNSYSDSSALSGVNISYVLSGTNVDNITTDGSGDFTKSSLASGIYTLSYSNLGYVDETQSATLATENQTLTVGKLRMLYDNCSSTGNVSGTISDAVSGDNVATVAISFRRGLNTTSGTAYATDSTNVSGAYSINNVPKGWYTAQTSKSGYSNSIFNVVSCGNVSSQDSAISTTLSSTAMRIITSWPTGSTANDLDSHISIPDNSSGTYHLYFDVDTGGSGRGDDYYVYGAGDNTTLDRDDEDGAPGAETITITHVKSGNYSFSVHDFTNRASNSISKIASSGATVTVYYNNTTTTYNAPSAPGTLWEVFTFTTSGGLVEVGTMSYKSDAAEVY